DDGQVISSQLRERVVAGICDEHASGREHDGLRREPQQRGNRFRWDVRPVSTVKGALALVLVDELGDQRVETVCVTLAGELSDDVPLGVDERERRPGTNSVRTP